MVQQQDQMLGAIQLFQREDGTTSIWDHPNFKSSIALPDDYKPLTRAEEGLELIKRRRLNEEQIMVLKVVADAMCANENQLRRYLSKKISPSVTSKHLKVLGKFGLVERHKCRLAFIEEEGKEVIRPPGPHTLGIGGYKLMNHLYNESNFATSDSWRQDSMAVQRYVAMNEVRCLAVESGSVRGWTWHPFVGGLSKYKKPFAAMRLETEKGELQFLIDRAQMSQNFVGYLQMRLAEFRYIHDRQGKILIDGFTANPMQQVVVISVSSVSMAKFLQEQLRLHTYPFMIWLLIDEWFDEKTGLQDAFAEVSKEGIRRIRLAVFRKKEPPERTESHERPRKR